MQTWSNHNCTSKLWWDVHSHSTRYRMTMPLVMKAWRPSWLSLASYLEGWSLVVFIWRVRILRGFLSISCWPFASRSLDLLSVSHQQILQSSGDLRHYAFIRRFLSFTLFAILTLVVWDIRMASCLSHTHRAVALACLHDIDDWIVACHLRTSILITLNEGPYFPPVYVMQSINSLLAILGIYKHGDWCSE